MQALYPDEHMFYTSYTLLSRYGILPRIEMTRDKQNDWEIPRYDAFISYSHAADGLLGPAIQRLMERIAKPWFKLRAMRIFLDQTDLTATPDGWLTIERELLRSRYLILLASPKAAESEWVGKEVNCWLEHRDPTKILIGLTDGELAWTTDDEGRVVVDWSETTALPRSFDRVFEHEPLWADLRSVQSSEDLNLNESNLYTAAARIAAEVRGIELRSLNSLDHREHRRTIRTAAFAVCLLISLLGIAIFFAVNASRATTRAINNTKMKAVRTYAEVDPTTASLFLTSVVDPHTVNGWRDEALKAISRPLADVIFRGHQGRMNYLKGAQWLIQDAQFSPSGASVLSVADDGTASVFPTNGRGAAKVFGLKIPRQHGSTTDELARFSLSGDLIFATGHHADVGVRIWDVANASLIREVSNVRLLGDSPAGIWMLTFDQLLCFGEGEEGPHTLTQWGGSNLKSAIEAVDGLACAALGPSGHRFVVGTLSGSLHFWNLVDAKVPPVVRKIHAGSVNSVRFSADGQRIVSASADGSAQVSHSDGRSTAISLRPTDAPEGDSKWVEYAEFSPDGQHIVTASWDGWVRLWSASDGEFLTGLHEHTGPVNSARYSSNGLRIVTASDDGKALIWEQPYEVGSRVLELRHGAPVDVARFSPDGQYIVTGGADGSVRVWPVSGSRWPLILNGDIAVLSPDGRHVAISGDEGTRLVKIGADGSVKEERWLDAASESVAFGPRGYQLAVAQGQTVVVLDLRDRSKRTVTEGKHDSDVSLVKFSADGNLIASTSDLGDDHLVKVWEATSGRMVAEFKGHRDAVHDIAFGPRGRRVATASSDGTAIVWRIPKSVSQVAAKRVLKGHEADSIVWTVRFSRDGKSLVTASSDGTARVWSSRTGELTAVLRGHGGPVSGAEFSPDSSTILTASHDYAARLWNPRGEALRTLQHGSPAVRVATFSADGELILTAADDGYVRLWEVDTVADAVLLPGVHVRGYRISGGGFSSDGSTVFTAAEDDTTRIWRVSISVLQEELRRASTASLSPALLETELGLSVEEALRAYTRSEEKHGRN